MLADGARDRLRAARLDDRAIEKLADRYTSENRDENVDAFIVWALENAAVDEASEQSFPASDPPSTWASSGGTA